MCRQLYGLSSQRVGGVALIKFEQSSSLGYGTSQSNNDCELSELGWITYVIALSRAASVVYKM